jgi:hypothetical protein
MAGVSMALTIVFVLVLLLATFAPKLVESAPLLPSQAPLLNEPIGSIQLLGALILPALEGLACLVALADNKAVALAKLCATSVAEGMASAGGVDEASCEGESRLASPLMHTRSARVRWIRDSISEMQLHLAVRGSASALSSVNGSLVDGPAYVGTAEGHAPVSAERMAEAVAPPSGGRPRLATEPTTASAARTGGWMSQFYDRSRPIHAGRAQVGAGDVGGAGGRVVERHSEPIQPVLDSVFASITDLSATLRTSFTPTLRGSRTGRPAEMGDGRDVPTRESLDRVIVPPARGRAGWANVRFLSRGVWGAWRRYLVGYGCIALALLTVYLALPSVLSPLIVGRERQYPSWVVGSSIVGNLFFLTFLYAPLPPMPPGAAERPASATGAPAPATRAQGAAQPFLSDGERSDAAATSEAAATTAPPAAQLESARSRAPFVNDPAFLLRIGVVVPCHKSADEIGHTLRSLLRYFEPQHIVVCDNGNNLTPMAQDGCATKRVVDAVSAEHAARLPSELRHSARPIQYVFIPEGHKTQALCVGALRLHSLTLPPGSAGSGGSDGGGRRSRAVEYILHIDDDTILSESMVFDETLFLKDRHLAAVAFPRTSPKTNLVTASVDFFYKKADHMGWAQAQTTGTRPYIPGPCGLWRLDVYLRMTTRHPFLPFGEDIFGSYADPIRRAHLLPRLFPTSSGARTATGHLSPRPTHPFTDHTHLGAGTTLSASTSADTPSHPRCDATSPPLRPLCSSSRLCA